LVPSCDRCCATKMPTANEAREPGGMTGVDLVLR